jgi:hypothetical protein
MVPRQMNSSAGSTRREPFTSPTTCSRHPSTTGTRVRSAKEHFFQDVALIAPVSRSEQAQGANPQKFTITVTRDDARLLVDGAINHHKYVRFIIDTGREHDYDTSECSFTVRTRNQTSPADRSSRPRRGIDGRLIEIDSLSVGNVEARNFDVVVIEDGLRGMGLLGADFLSRFHLDINYNREQMVLHQSDGPYDGYPAARWQEKFRLYRRLKQPLNIALNRMRIT